MKSLTLFHVKHALAAALLCGVALASLTGCPGGGDAGKKPDPTPGERAKGACPAPVVDADAVAMAWYRKARASKKVSPFILDLQKWRGARVVRTWAEGANTVVYLVPTDKKQQKLRAVEVVVSAGERPAVVKARPSTTSPLPAL